MLIDNEETANLRAKQDIVDAKLKPLQLFNTPEAVADRARLTDELRDTRHRITMLKPLKDRIVTFQRTLANKHKKLETAYRYMRDT